MNGKKGKPGRDKRKAEPQADASDRQEVSRLKCLLKLMDDHQLTELEIGPDGRSVRMSRVRESAPAAIAYPAFVPPAATPAVVPAAALAGGAPAVPAADPDLVAFLSPMVGTFYRAASPEAAAFVKEGDPVQPGTVLCMIEAMKVFNEIQCDSAGQVVQILVENGEAVEYGQPLFQIRRSG